VKYRAVGLVEQNRQTNWSSRIRGIGPFGLKDGHKRPQREIESMDSGTMLAFEARAHKAATVFRAGQKI
jgi:hypothetical protein